VAASAASRASVSREEISKIANTQFREYAEPIYSKKSHSAETRDTCVFKKQSLIYLSDMDVVERDLFIANNLSNYSPIETSNKVHFKNKCKYLPTYFSILFVD